ncbi:hypothetical protein Tco_0729588 [Tanacetum coccineum]|uniref:Uncharacterized protein n=1 Tax=Tanacetum coccineum TaxID=301880 RepID=A0ABQ4YS31_9ASTR
MFKCVRPLAGKTFQKEFRSAGWCKENRDGQKTIAVDKHPSDTKVLTMKMEILLEPTSNKLLEILLLGNHVQRMISFKMKILPDSTGSVLKDRRSSKRWGDGDTSVLVESIHTQSAHT